MSTTSRIPVPVSSSSPRNSQTSAQAPPSQEANPNKSVDREKARNEMSSISGSNLPGSPAPAPSTPSGPGSTDTRMKQSRRDETLRRKIESELSRKRPAPSQHTSSYFSNSSSQPSGGASGTRSSRRTPAAARGTVAALKPSPALTVPESMTVSDASQLCAAKRTDCVLVVDDEEGLSGIFTAKDLAFRVTAEGLDPRQTLVSQIMTKNPMVTRDTTSATQALQLMVEKHFRHLPVCNEDGDVVGLLDITKVFHEALGKIERSSTASAQLTAALAGVQTELGPGLATNPQAAAMMAYAEALRERMALPDLTTVMNTRLAPPTVTPRTSVMEAAKLMKDRRTTAVCIVDAGSNVSGTSTSKIQGIFTSKDVVLRVIAAGLDPKRCSVVRVMTPHPDTAPPTMSVQDALKKMYNGHYLNLPVVDAEGRLVGIVDVLKLTYATLEQIESMNDSSSETGPMWGKFFDDLGQAGPVDDETGSMISADTPATPSIPRHLRNVTSPHSEIQPGDSASAADDASEIAPGASSVAPAPFIDDGTYIFKFRTPSGRTHRFQARSDNYENLQEIVAGKLAADPFFVDGIDASLFTMSYTDDDGDSVTITSDGDVTDAVRIARSQKSDRVVLVITGDKSWDEVDKEEPIPSKAVDEVVPVSEEKESINESQPPARARRKAVTEDDKVMGIPKELLLPASIGFLGVVVIAVFVASRAGNKSA